MCSRPCNTYMVDGVRSALLLILLTLVVVGVLEQLVVKLLLAAVSAAPYFEAVFGLKSLKLNEIISNKLVIVNI